MLSACAVLATLVATPAQPVQTSREEISARYRALHASKDEVKMRTLWREHPGLILVTIDADLETSLAALEAAGGTPPEREIAEREDRALWGALMASDVTGRPLFADYAASFVGWSRDEQARYRAGQLAYQRAVKALKDGAHAEALTAAGECRAIAEALGDWPGVARGASAQGRAYEAGGRLEEALASTSCARLLYQQLYLARDEYLNLRAMVSLCTKLGRWHRAHACANAAIDLAREFQDEGAVRELLRERVRIEVELRLDDAAAKTMAELESL